VADFTTIPALLTLGRRAGP